MAASPPLSSLPHPLTPPFTRLPTGVGVWERRGAETARSGGVWWGTPDVNEAACTLVSSWVQEGSVEGYHAARAAGPAVRTRTTPAIRLMGQDAGPERGASTAAGLHPLPGPSITAPPSQTPQHDEDTRSPVYFGHFSPLDTLFYYLC